MGSRIEGMQHMLLRQRILQTLDKTGWSTVLVLLDVILSFLSVLLYIVMTYGVRLDVLYDIDFALAIFFGANWLFWFWLAEDRLRYVFSLMTFIDVVTVGSAFVLYGLEGDVAQNIPGLNFLRILRILRILRLFQMENVMQRHLEGAVVEAATKLVFTLISILFIAAGLFYELEKFGPTRDEEQEMETTLQFHEALYWASVTLTTVGYGDFSPTWWATQMMLIILLVLTFTLLPYMTGQLMDALGSSTHYQRCSFSSFSRRSDVGHVVIMGALDGPTLEGLVSELYHEDKGFNHQQCVFLCPRPPSLDQQHVLVAHPASRKLHYLQGSAFKTQDLARAGCAYASAIFIIAPKHAEEPLLADRHNIMMCLSLGQYLQEMHVLLRQQLSSLPNRIWHWITHGHMYPPSVLPTIFIQINLPESRIRLHQVLRSLQDSHRDANSHAPSAYSAATAAASAAATAAAEHLQQHKQQAPAAADYRRLLFGFVTVGQDSQRRQAAHNGADRHLLQQQQEHKEAAAFEAGAAAGADAAAKAASAAAAAGIASPGADCTQDMKWCPGVGDPPTGAIFWHHYGRSMRVMCLSDVKHAMMAHTLLGVPGVMTLLSNLSSTADYGPDDLGKVGGVPQHLKDYMVGASQELYQMTSFPEALHGVSFKTAASFIYDTCHAVLLAVEETEGPQRHLLTVANLNQVIHVDMHGYVIAEDIAAVVDIMAVEQQDLEAWQQQQAQKAAHSGTGLEGAHQRAAAMRQSQQQMLHWPPGTTAAQQQLSHSSGARKHMVAWRSGQLQMTPAERETLRRFNWSADHCNEWYFDPTQNDLNQQDMQQPQMQTQTSVGSGPSVASAAAASAAVAAISSSVAMIGQQHKEHNGALAAVIHLLRSPSHQLQKYGESFMRQHYHLRQGGAVKNSQDMVVSRVPAGMNGHILVLGVPRSQESLLALLAPLRSRRLSRLRPIVIIDAESPGRGGCWDMIAKFKHTYYIQMRAGINEALLNANAEAASHAVLLSPLSAHEDELDDNKLTSKVMTDAMIIHMYQLLHSLNPNMQLVAELMLPQNMAYLAPTTPLRGVQQRQQVMLSPAFVSGSVFMSRTLDDLLIASYFNNIGDRIMLQLLHKWHLGGRMATYIDQALDTDGDLEQQQQQAGTVSVAAHQQYNERQQQQQQLSGDADVEMGLNAQDQLSSGGGVHQQQRQKAEHVQAAGPAAVAGGDMQVHTPTIIMVPVHCPAGTPYRSYFHQLLIHEDLLLLGLYRLVQQGGLQYRITLTNPHHTTLQSDDLAYVVSTLRFPEQVDSSSATAAWPPDTVGFNNLVPPPAPLEDVLDVAAEAAAGGGGRGTAAEAATDQQHDVLQERAKDEAWPEGQWEKAADETSTAAAIAAAEKPTSQEGQLMSPPSGVLQQRQQRLQMPGTAGTGPRAVKSPTAAAEPSSPECYDDSQIPLNTTSSFPFCSTAAKGSSPLTDMYTPAGTASSGTAGPGVSAAAAPGADAADGGQRRSVIRVPGLVTTKAKKGGQQQGGTSDGRGGGGSGGDRDTGVV